MPVATEVSSTYATTPAIRIQGGRSGHIDVNLVLEEAVAITATGNGTAKTIEGGDINCEFVIVIGAVTGTSPTMTSVLQVSPDGGSNYYDLIQLPALDANDANQVIARTCYIPRPTGTNRTVLVRHKKTIGGSATPTFNITTFLRDGATGSRPGLEYLT